MAASHINSALQYHDARYLCGVKGGSDRTMSTFCFINAASRYHASPAKQRAVHKDKIVDGHAHYTLKANHRLPAVGMRKSPGRCRGN